MTLDYVSDISLMSALVIAVASSELTHTDLNPNLCLVLNPAIIHLEGNQVSSHTLQAQFSLPNFSALVNTLVMDIKT